MDKTNATKETLGLVSMSMPRADLVKHLRNPDFYGPMIHLRDWSELQVLMHRAADLLRRAEEDEIVADALAARANPLSEGEWVVTDEMVEAALLGRVPGGSDVMVWLPMADAFKTTETARDVIRAALTAALAASPSRPLSEGLEGSQGLMAARDHEPSTGDHDGIGGSWRAIGTAPKEDLVLVWDHGIASVAVAAWSHSRCKWFMADSDTGFDEDLCWIHEPTHWMPLPAPPAGIQGERS